MNATRRLGRTRKEWAILPVWGFAGYATTHQIRHILDWMGM